MARIPSKPDKIFDEFVNDYKKIFGPDLFNIILYGSIARGEYTPKRSDVNLMVVLSETAIKSLAKAIPLVQKWKNQGVGIPLFLTKSDIFSSLDSFPLEFINIKTDYVSIYGEDVIKSIVFDGRLVRIQCERKIKGLLIKLRQSFLKTEGSVHKIEELISLSLPTILMIFKVVIFMRQHRMIADRENLLDCMGQETGLNQVLFEDLLAIKEGRKKLPPEKAIPLMEYYIEEIGYLSACIDQLDTELERNGTGTAHRLSTRYQKKGTGRPVDTSLMSI